jgi:hypothetical protein
MGSGPPSRRKVGAISGIRRDRRTTNADPMVLVPAPHYFHPLLLWLPSPHVAVAVVTAASLPSLAKNLKRPNEEEQMNLGAQRGGFVLIST